MFDDPTDPVSACRREVGRCTRTAWNALHVALAKFQEAKERGDDGMLAETGAACDDALSELARLQDALRSLRASCGDSTQARLGIPAVSERESFLE